jgi:hypothetical protein
MWLVISRACEDCGSKMAVFTFEKVPTKEQIDQTEDSIGGMFCIKTNVLNLHENEKFIIE